MKKVKKVKLMTNSPEEKREMGPWRGENSSFLGLFEIMEDYFFFLENRNLSFTGEKRSQSSGSGDSQRKGMKIDFFFSQFFLRKKIIRLVFEVA